MSRARKAITLPDLDDYLSRTMSEEDAVGFEEALFDAAAAGTSPELAFVERFRTRARDLAERGTFNVVMTPAQAQELVRTSPLRVMLVKPHEYRGNVEADLRSHDVFLFHFDVDTRGAERIDLEMGTAERTLFTAPDVDFDPKQDGIVLACEQGLVYESYRQQGQTRIVAVDGAERRVLGTFGFANLQNQP